eukprot:m.90988 g.90988  ORF g.90988 m.90988 type:complete len:901 (-) comp15287_c0_seq1:264-2966(-)
MAAAKLAVLVLCVAVLAAAVDRNNFKKCSDSSFCKRNRALTPDHGKYAVDASSLDLNDQRAVMDLNSDAGLAKLQLTLSVVNKGLLRATIVEKNPIRPRYQVQDVVTIESTHKLTRVRQEEKDILVFDFVNEQTVVVTLNPFRLDLLRAGEIVISVNSRGLLNYESFQARPETPFGGDWEESFKTHADSKPHGPSSVGIDFSFPGVEHVYGIPEHASSLALKETVNSDPYRLYNLDVFEYELDNPMALYGSIPFMVAHRKKQTSAVFLLNASEMWVDIALSKLQQGLKGTLRKFKSFFGQAQDDVPQTDTHWFAESGILDFYLFSGPTARDVYYQYAKLTGMPQMPPLFALAFHQCRWNYNDEADVAFVDSQFDRFDIPVDVIWLDIEHTDGKRYMVWDRTKFPHPEQMQNSLAERGRKMVTIVDPHIKRAPGYGVHEKASSLGYYIKNKDGAEYDGWCWPGSSSWLDFLSPQIQDWWADQLSLENYGGSTRHLHVWNDMNEPSVFNGPEITMHKDAKHVGGWEHRDVHNIYGMWQQAATAKGLLKRSGNKERPFVLSRAFFAGSQKYGAIWTGDNTANWAHLEASLPMLLSINAAGLPFAGADIGGFFGNPDNELQLRWFQAGAYQPFMRAHAHLDTRRREPYLLPDNERKIVRDAIRTRYTFLPYIYTVFHEAHTTGLPVMRPMWLEFPDDAHTFAMSTQYMFGNALMVAPVTKQGSQSVEVYFPGDQPWYDMENFKSHQAGATMTIAAPLRKIPVFQRGGTIVPRKLRVRRSSSLSHKDPISLVVALTKEGLADGEIYVDDYNSTAFETGKFLIQSYSASTSGRLLQFQAKGVRATAPYRTTEWVERIFFFGVKTKPSAVTCQGSPCTYQYEDNMRILTIRKPAFKIGDEYSIHVTL